MTFEQMLGLIASVYATPLPTVMDMPISSVVYYGMQLGATLKVVEPLFADASKAEETLTSDALLGLLR